jgi:FAD/FMN-containing dehydrogenase
VAVVPFGGGTSTVGGLAVRRTGFAVRRTGFAGVIALDLGRPDRLVAVDPVGRTATFEPGVRAPAAESLLAAHGLTLGHYPQSFEFAAVRRLAQDGPLPTVLRLADEYETALNLVRPGQDDPATAGGCLAIVGHEGADVTGRRAAAGAVLRDAGATSLGPELDEARAQGRFGPPYLRDALLDAGALAEVVETATFWSGLMPLYAAVRSARPAGRLDPAGILNPGLLLGSASVGQA